MILLVVIFIIGYILIATEHQIHINKAATALVTGALCWTIYSYISHENIHSALHDMIAETSSILFFLLGAMTIVELIDSHGGFEVITSRLQIENKTVLIWVIIWITYFLSSILDNLTTAIVMVTLVTKLFQPNNERMLLSALVVIAANAGGAWSPIGDVTTTMLWIQGSITPLHIMKSIFLPSVMSLLIPLLILSRKIKKNLSFHAQVEMEFKDSHTNEFEKKLILTLGLLSFILVPIFKTVTHLPPFMGILFFLGLLWMITEILHLQKDPSSKHHLSVMNAISRIDTPSILFFFGILSAVSALQASGLLRSAAEYLTSHIGNIDVIIVGIGLVSSVLDNVPLVAACMGMFDHNLYPTDHHLWNLLAYCAGTGGSILVIGSAAGIAAMGIEKMDFVWYLRKISWVALLGYMTGVAVYFLFY